MRIVVRPVKFAYGRAAHGDFAAVCPYRAHEQGNAGGFAAAAFAHDCGKAVFGKGHINAFEHFLSAAVGKGDVLYFKCGRGHFLISPLRFGQGEQLQNFTSRGRAVHSHVESRAERTQWQEEFHRHQRQKEYLGRFESAVHARPYGKRDSRARAAVRHQIHNGGGHELHYEHLHGYPAEFFAALVHLLVARAVGAEYLQFFKPLHAV